MLHSNEAGTGDTCQPHPRSSALGWGYEVFVSEVTGDVGKRRAIVRKPSKPVEVAYFNYGPLVHAGVTHYDASRGLIYAPGGSGFQVLAIEPQVAKRLQSPRWW